MNRAERRKAQKAGQPVKKDPMISIKSSDITRMKREATKEAAGVAFSLMLGLPAMVLRDKYGFGKTRLERFTDQVLELYDSFGRGYITLQDVLDTIQEETGVDIEGRGVEHIDYQE